MPSTPPTLDELCEQSLNLPCSPALMPKLISALKKEDSTADDIERIIQVDAALAGSTLRLANSAYYGAREPIATLEQAIMMLGHKEIYKLASLTLVSRWESQHHKLLPWEPGDYARHSLCTALAAEVIAEASGGDPELSYTAGLVGDLGKLALAHGCAEHYPAVSAYCKEHPVTWEHAEKAVFGYDHTEVGTRLLRSWHFPEMFAQAVEWQLRPQEAPAEALPLLAQLHAAKFIAVSLGPGVTEGGFSFTLYGNFLTEWGFTVEFLEEAMMEVQDRAFRRVGDQLSMGLFKA